MVAARQVADWLNGLRDRLPKVDRWTPRTEGLVDRDDGVTARDVLEAAPDALAIVNEAGHIVQVNAPTAQLFGYRRDELLGQAIDMLIPARFRAAHGSHRAAYHHDLCRRPMGAGPELYGVRKDGREFPVEISLSPLVIGRGTLVIAAIRDISARKRAEAERDHLIRERALYAEISRLASHDALTGLPNRAVLNDRLTTAIAAASRHERQVAVLFLDLDRFKLVNDSLGHSIGDRLLQSAASRLAASVRAADTVSRQGGDEFVILLSDVPHDDNVAATTAKIVDAVSGPYCVAGHDLHVTVSVGISLYPEDGQDAETLIKNADIAMYYAKDHGRDHCQFFTPDMNARAVERQSMEGRLRGALDRREFVLHYQPKVDIETGEMIGAEALIRWQHPDRGLLPPARFVPIAEDSGLIVPIGQWVLREACRQERAWQDAGLDPVPVAVNISALEFRGKDFLAGVRRILDDTGIEPSFLELELTETVLMDSLDSTASVLRELKGMGLRLAVDDFGTGYSSLSYLMRFPIDALKLDQSFVREITAAAGGSPIIAAAISIGRSLNQRVIAEGVETAEQLAFLQAQHCQEGQGYHFSRPLIAEEFGALLARAG
jgi:diguanylate cyclase (GGDEF)-like protein/PAS domain S-box-containing protein